MLTFYRHSMDGQVYRQADDSASWEGLNAEGDWVPIPVPLSQQDYEHLREIPAEEAVLPA